MKYHMVEGEVEFIKIAKPFPSGFINQARTYLDCILNTAVRPTNESTGWGPVNIIPPLPKIGIYEDVGLVFKRGSDISLAVDEFDSRVKIGEPVIVYQSVRITPYSKVTELK